jgi:hypothetical protein
VLLCRQTSLDATCASDDSPARLPRRARSIAVSIALRHYVTSSELFNVSCAAKSMSGIDPFESLNTLDGTKRFQRESPMKDCPANRLRPSILAQRLFYSLSRVHVCGQRHEQLSSRLLGKASVFSIVLPLLHSSVSGGPL